MESLKLGVSVTSIAQEMDSEIIALLGSSRIETFELHGARLPLALRDEFRAMLRSTGKRAKSWHIPYGDAFDVSALAETARAAAVERVKLELAAAATFECEFAVIHASFEPIPDHERLPRIAAVRRSLLELEPLLKKNQLRMAVELLPRSCIGRTGEELLALLDGMDPVFGACLDVNHLMADFRALPRVVRQLGKRLQTLHISDYDGIDEKHWLPGAGVIEWPPFLEALREIGYAGPFNYELRSDYAATAEARIRCLEENFAALMAGSRNH